MHYKKQAKKIALHTPKLRNYISRKDLLEAEAVAYRRATADYQKTIRELEKRNEAWAAEVRELRGDNKRLEILWPVFEKDILAANWDKPRKLIPYKRHKPPFILNWVIPPMGPVSGGHADILRFINYLESKGHECRIYFYEALGHHELNELKKLMENYPPVKAELYYNAKTMKDADAIFATNWYSAYPVFNYKGAAKKFYFVQDFEPYFEPVGTYSTLAENTYKFGFYGITLGQWLSDKLSKEYSMQTDYLDFGTEMTEYHLTNKNKRKKILYYARPVTPRRGFELGCLALKIFHEQHPDYEIHCLGWDLSRYDLPFPYVNHGILSPKELNELYNQCVGGLVLSFTNMSLLPLEMISAGCIPVMNDSTHTKMATYSDYLKYAKTSPTAIADALHEIVTDPNQLKASQEAAKYAQNFKWDKSKEKLEEILEKELGS